MYKYNKEIESLIEMAISDGEITDKELKVLQKKAAQYNIDEDELDMVLEYRLENRRKELGLNNQSKSDIETDKTQTRDYNKCNSCGFIRQNDEDKCPYCGYVFPSALDIFKIELNNVSRNNRLKKEKISIKDSIVSSFKRDGVFGVLGSILGGEEDCQDFNEYATIVTGFEVPAKNEVLLESITFFYSRIQSKEDLSSHWIAKYKELYNAAINRFPKSLFSKSKERDIIDRQYNELKKNMLLF